MFSPVFQNVVSFYGHFVYDFLKPRSI